MGLLRLCVGRRLAIRTCAEVWIQSCQYSAGPNRTIHKVLIANRGEIACRVLRTAKRMGIRSVGVFSEPDRNSLHVQLADEAYLVGPAASAESYLRQDKILDIALRTGADAIHPGYGFLSENAEFADICQEKNIIFMGPPSTAIRDMGIKNTAKQIMVDAGVPVVEGYHGADQSDAVLKAESQKIGFPVMLKAVRGGGGKGMRIAFTEAEFDEQLDSARRESMKSFGNDDMIVEKFVENPRHVEVQVFGDNHGNYVYLFERDCSVQRRHQKIVEEAPAPGISEETRRSLGEAAVRAAAAVNYSGAGTVEFIMDPKENFYFMEMNTRLQVEHPVTEMITGTDLVEWQFRVAQGEHLPVDQSGVVRHGHSAEARIYAEDPDNNFMPGAGILAHLSVPNPIPDYLRIETGVREGDEVSVHYDPMISKLVVWSQDRESAFRRLDSVLADYHIVGLRTNVQFLRSLINHKDFLAGKVYTEFIPDHYDELFPTKPTPSISIIAQAAAAILIRKLSSAKYDSESGPNDPFSAQDFYRVNSNFKDRLKLMINESEIIVDLVRHKDGNFTASSSDKTVTFRVAESESKNRQVDEFTIELDDSILKTKSVWYENEMHLFTNDGRFEFSIPEPNWKLETQKASGVEGGSTAPMPGVIEKVMVSPGQEVEAGQPMVVMVAMKMEYVIKAPKAGKIAQVSCQEGESVSKNAILVVLE